VVVNSQQYLVVNSSRHLEKGIDQIIRKMSRVKISTFVIYPSTKIHVPLAVELVSRNKITKHTVFYDVDLISLPSHRLGTDFEVIQVVNEIGILRVQSRQKHPQTGAF
jgi:hypothetical protein